MSLDSLFDGTQEIFRLDSLARQKYAPHCVHTATTLSFTPRCSPIAHPMLERLFPEAPQVYAYHLGVVEYLAHRPHQRPVHLEGNRAYIHTQDMSHVHAIGELYRHPVILAHLPIIQVRRKTRSIMGLTNHIHNPAFARTTLFRFSAASARNTSISDHPFTRDLRDMGDSEVSDVMTCECCRRVSDNLLPTIPNTPRNKITQKNILRVRDSDLRIFPPYPLK